MSHTKTIRMNERKLLVLIAFLFVLTLLFLLTAVENYQLKQIVAEYQNISSECLYGWNKTLYKWVGCEQERQIVYKPIECLFEENGKLYFYEDCE